MAETIVSVSPNDGRVIAEFAPDGPETLALHLVALEAALPTLRPVRVRKALLQAFARHLQAMVPDLVTLVIRETGKTPSESTNEVDYALSFVHHALASLDRALQPVSTAPDQRTDLLAAGIALLITPFNDPVAGLTRKIAPAIAAGCPVFVKPSPLGLATAVRVMAALTAAAEETAPGAAALLVTEDPKLVGHAFAHPLTAVVSFTGSTATGRLVAETAGRHLVRPVLELGGNAPFLVLSDANLDIAVADLVERKRKAAGQACSAVNRVFVSREIYPQFRSRLLDAIAAVRTGPADAPEVQMGPVRTASSVLRLERLVAKARRHGERVIGAAAGAQTAPFVFPLTILEADAGVPSVLDGEEAFGPLLSLRPFDDATRAIDEALNVSHALVAYLYSHDSARIAHFLEAARFGSVGINTTRIQGADVPTGGFGEAGYGREGGAFGVHEYLAPRNLRAASPECLEAQ